MKIEGRMLTLFQQNNEYSRFGRAGDDTTREPPSKKAIHVPNEGYTEGIVQLI